MPGEFNSGNGPGICPYKVQVRRRRHVLEGVAVHDQVANAVGRSERAIV
jgi:hypothetical protein